MIPNVPSPARHHHGFTLVEMLLVLSFIAIMAGAAVVSLAGREHTHALRLAGKDLATTLRWTAHQARITARPHRLLLAEDGRGYRVEVLVSDNEDFQPVQGPMGKFRTLPADVRILSHVPETATHAIEFLPDGTGFCGNLRLCNSKSEILEVRVVSHTAQVHVVEAE